MQTFFNNIKFLKINNIFSLDDLKKKKKIKNKKIKNCSE